MALMFICTDVWDPNRVLLWFSVLLAAKSIMHLHNTIWLPILVTVFHQSAANCVEIKWCPNRARDCRDLCHSIASEVLLRNCLKEYSGFCAQSNYAFPGEPIHLTWTTGWYGYRCLLVDATYMQCLQFSHFVFGGHLIVAQGFDLEKCIYISWSRLTIQSGSFRVSSSGSCTGIQLWLILSCVCYVHLCCICCSGEFGWGWRVP